MIKNIGSFSLMKNMNMSLVLGKIQEYTCISRAQIAKETGLTAATVTNLTAELIDDEIVTESETGSSTGGRKPIMLQMNTEKFGVCATYISPDKVEFVAANFLSEIIYYNSIPFGRTFDKSICVDFIVSEYNKIAEKSGRKIIGLCVGIHGLVNSTDGISVFAPNLEWCNVAIRDMLKKHIKIPIYIDNDVRLMTLGEMWFGNAKNASDMVYVYIGNGIGSSLVINGDLYRGYGSGAGEIGHCMVKSNGPLCYCGNTGCLQTVANTAAMQKYIIKAVNSGKYITTLTAESTLDDLILAGNSGDSGANAVFKKEAEYLSIGIGNIINTINPHMIVIDSSIKGFGKAIIPYIQALLPKRSMKYQRAECIIKYSSLEDMAVLKGGTALAIKMMYENPDIIKQ